MPLLPHLSLKQTVESSSIEVVMVTSQIEVQAKTIKWTHEVSQLRHMQSIFECRLH